MTVRMNELAVFAAKTPKIRARPGSRTAARAALIWMAGIFLVLQSVMSIGIERWLPEFRDPLYAFKVNRLQRRLIAKPDRPLSVVVLGSSRTIFGLNAQLLEAPLSQTIGRPVVVFNFGVTGAGPVTTLVTLKRLLASDVRPDLLVLELLPPLLTCQPELSEVYRFSGDHLWLDDLSVIERYSITRLGLREDWWLAACFPWYYHRFAIMSRLVPAYLPWRLRQDWFQSLDDSGWVDSPASMIRPQRRPDAIERTQKEYAPYFEHYQLGGRPCTAVIEQLEICRQQKIPVVFLLMPEGSDFRSWYRGDSWSQVEHFMSGLQAEYGVPIINAREWIGDEEFADGHHLLLPGATRFTQRLGLELLPHVDTASRTAAAPSP